MANEILVHVSAPVTRHNDDLCLAVANAYLDFILQDAPEGQHDEHFSSMPPPTESNVDIGSPASISHASCASQTVKPLMFTASKDSYGSFPSHVSSERQDGHDSKSQLNGVNESGILMSSRLAHLERIHQQWKWLEIPSSGLTTCESLVNTKSSRTNYDTTTTFLDNTQLAAQVSHSQLQDDLSLTVNEFSDNKEAVGYEIDHPSRRNKALILDIKESFVPPPFLSELGCKAHSSLVEDADLHSSRSADSLKEVGAVDSIDFTPLPHDVFAPAPKISTESPGILPSQITEQLAVLKTQNPERFKPARYIRTLEADERGHWFITCSSWPTKLQYEFWCFLYKQVKSGRLGYGLTLFRENTTPATLGIVKLFCWGEIVEHTWLLLWLCSGGKIMESGASWIDADGVGVVRMP